MVTFQQLSESVGEPQPPSTQEELRKEVERLRIEVQLAARGIEINEGEVDVDIQLPPEAIAKGFTSPGDFVVKDGSLKYSDGGVYEGEVLGSLRHGKGTYTRGDGAQYSGQWRYDALEGRATAITPDGQTYEGEWRGGRANGHGVATYPNGSRYEGDFANDGRHGWGTQTFPLGENYEGEWANDKIQGQGRWTYSDGSYFEGEWHNGIRVKGNLVTADGSEKYSGDWDEHGRSGNGVQYIKGAFKYDGEWQADKQHGKGRCIYADGAAYEGDWREGVRCGQGKLAHGAFAYDGGWVDDRPDGQGMCKEENGDRYVGGFSKGERHGFGRCVYADGSKYEGEWQNGVRCGEGACVFPNGDMYKGSWERNKRHGLGVCRFADGTRFKGRWEDDGWVQSAADPGRCKVAGAGLTRAEAGRETSFAIQARDEEGNKRLNGGDEFQVQLTLYPEGGDAVVNTNEMEAKEENNDNVVVVVPTVKDNDDGTYAVSYIATVAGVYELSITVGGIEHVADSPYPVRVRPSKPSPRNSLVSGQGRSWAVAGATATFEIIARDEYENRCSGDTTLIDQMQLEIYLEGPGVPKLAVDTTPTRDGRLLCSYSAPTAQGYYRLYIEHGGNPLPGTPYSVHVVSAESAAASNGEGAGSLASGDHQASGDPSNNNDGGEMNGDDAGVQAASNSSLKETAGGIPDTMRLWEKIAAAAYAFDGAADGWDSEEERMNKKESSAEDAYLQKHPDVPVVENLEDLWLVSKLQKERKAKEEQEKVVRMTQMKQQLESTFGPGQVPTQQEAEAALKEILHAEKAEKKKTEGALSQGPCIAEIEYSGGGTVEKVQEDGKKQSAVVRLPKDQLLAAAASLDELA